MMSDSASCTAFIGTRRLAQGPLAEVALAFGAPEYTSIMLFGLIAASTLSGGSMLKGLAMVVLGVVLGTVGMDMNTGV